MTGEDITVSRKGIVPVETFFDFPVLLTCNDLPRVKDDSDAVYKRSLVLPMRHEFNEDEAPDVPTWRTVVDTELSGVLNWALKGWQRLNKRRVFAPTDEMVEEIKTFKDENAPITSWVRECVESTKHRMVDNRDLRASIAGFYAQRFGENSKIPNPDRMHKVLKNILKAKPHKVTGNRYTAGVTLNEDGLACWENAVNLPFSKYVGSGVTKAGVNAVCKKGALF